MDLLEKFFRFYISKMSIVRNIELIKQIFFKFDFDGNGSLDIDEFTAILD